MCTVSIIYKENNDFILTSNRDEAPHRVALAPQFYTMDDVEVLMPQDKLSGGSWVGVSNKNRVVCLLNGGFEIHKRQSSYRQSRGVVVRDLLSMNFIDEVEEYNFNDIEPFTIVIADWNTNIQFFEIVWDGVKAHFTPLELEPKVWSSSTLYTSEKKKERLAWFDKFTSENNLHAENILNFHKHAGEGNTDYGVVMDRGFVKTTSITQIEKIGHRIEMRFENLNTSEITTKAFNLSLPVNE